jgi:hypothetical protein
LTLAGLAHGVTLSKGVLDVQSHDGNIYAEAVVELFVVDVVPRVIRWGRRRSSQ